MNDAILTNGTNAARNTLPASKDSLALANHASSAWRNFEDAVKNISEHSSVFSKVTEAIDQRNAMEIEAQKKGKRIADLELSFQVQMDEHEKRYNKWMEEKNQSEQRATHTKAELNAQAQAMLKKQRIINTQDMEKLMKELEAEKNTVATLKAELEKASVKIHKVEKELRHCTEQMSEWKGYLSSLKDIDFKAFDVKVKQLFAHCCKIARSYFLRDLPTTFFTDPRWEDLHHSLDVPLAFPPSNSSAAKHVRMAACLHVLSHRLYTDFFKPCYIPGPPVLSHAIQLILAQQFMTEVGKESITRALLLSTYEPEEVDAAVQQIVDITSKDVFGLLSPLGGNEAFYKDVQVLFREAAAVWKEAQHSRKVVDARITDDFDDWKWSHLEEFAVAEIKAQAVPQRFDMLNLFPRISVPEDNHVVNHGFVLWPDQNIVVAAEQELRECMAARRSKGGIVSGGSMRRERRPSARLDGRSGVMGSSPTSLKTEKKAAFSEPQHEHTPRGQTHSGNRGEG